MNRFSVGICHGPIKDLQLVRKLEETVSRVGLYHEYLHMAASAASEISKLPFVDYVTVTDTCGFLGSGVWRDGEKR